MAELDLNIQQLEDMESPWDWSHTFMGVATGVALVGIAAT